MAQVAVVAKLTAAEGKTEDLKAVINDLVGAVSAGEPGTLIYAAAQEGDTGVFWFYELYGDPDAAAAHSGGEALKAAGAKMAGLLGGAPEIHLLTPVAGHGIPG